MKCKPYDDDELIRDIMEEKLLLVQIAAKHGLSPEQLTSILSGRRRPTLLARIVKLRGLTREDIRRTCAAHVKEILDIHIQAGRDDKGHVGRHCREFVLKHALSEDDFRLEGAPARPSSGTTSKRWGSLLNRIQKPAKRETHDQ